MDSEKIEKLIERYWECESTLEEEKELKAYFSKPDFDPKFKNIAPLFHFYNEEKQQGKLDGLFDEQVLSQIEKGSVTTIGRGKVINMFSNIAKVAAVILVIITAGYFINEEIKKEETQPYLTDTFEDPQKAFEETKKALAMISKNFNKGRKQAKKIATFNEAQEKVKENNL